MVLGNITGRSRVRGGLLLWVKIHNFWPQIQAKKRTFPRTRKRGIMHACIVFNGSMHPGVGSQRRGYQAMQNPKENRI